MQITETLNDKQRLMSLGHKEALEDYFPIFKDMVAEGYEVEFYYIRGYGGFTIVPSVKRIRVKANFDLMNSRLYVEDLANKIRDCFKSRMENPKFLAGKKVAVDFRKGNSNDL